MNDAVDQGDWIMILNVEDFRHLFEEWSRVMDKTQII